VEEENYMITTNRRFLVRAVALAPVAGAAARFISPARAQEGDYVVGRRYETIKRGTIEKLDPPTRGLVMVWDDLGRIKMKAADLVTNYAELKVGQVCDVRWVSYVDFLVARTTPEVAARAKAMVAQGARAEGIPGTEHQIRLFEHSGMVVRTDLTAYTVEIVSPSSGEVLRAPQILTETGLAELKTLKAGEAVTTVFSQETATKVTVIR
jgi:hypothetical protein